MSPRKNLYEQEQSVRAGRLKAFGHNMAADLDEGIRPIVLALVEDGIETFESCQGGEGHAFPEPTVRFHGPPSEGPRALSSALQRGLRPVALRRYWVILDGEQVGPEWEMTFARTA